MNKKLRYYFNYIDQCNMCGSPTASHKVLGRRLNRSQGRNPKTKVGIATSVAQCSSCSLVYANPQPVPFDLQDHYGVPPENYWKEHYFVPNENYMKGEIAIFKGLVDFKDGMKSLDIGAGLGKGMIALTKAGLDAYGFEPSKPFYERAISRMGIPADKLKLGMIEDMDYPENSFDFISFGAVLEHLYNPAQSIEMAMKWLKPEGIIYIQVPSSHWLVNKLVNFYYRLVGTDYVANISPMHDPYHLYEFGLASFQAHAQKHQYEVAFHEFYVCQTYMPKLADYLLKPYMKYTNTGMQLSVWLKKK
jgi:SAM-dependent methyltransferase